MKNLLIIFCIGIAVCATTSCSYGQKNAHQLAVRIVDDGGNPRSVHDIAVNEDGIFVRPFSEDGDGNYKFNLCVEVVNPLEAGIETTVTIEWGETRYQPYRNYVLVCSEGDVWKRYEAKIDRSLSIATITVPKGKSYLGLLPAYPFNRLSSLLDKIDENPQIHVSTIGTSRYGNPLYAVQAGNTDKRPLAVITRVHPYETQGSFFIEGMLKWLSGELTNNKYNLSDFLDKYHVVILPMVNPDGVILGTQKRTHGGLNISEDCADSPEPEAVAIRTYLYNMNPVVILDLHGWMNRRDNFVTNDSVRGQLLYDTFMSNKALFKYDIQKVISDYPEVGAEINIGGYLKDRCGANFINSSWSGFHRDLHEYHTIGITYLNTLSSLYAE